MCVCVLVDLEGVFVAHVCVCLCFNNTILSLNNFWVPKYTIQAYNYKQNATQRSIVLEKKR